MDGFVPAHLAPTRRRAVHDGVYRRGDIPFHWALADAFTVCDGYHCSMRARPGPRLYLLPAWSPDGRDGGPVTSTRCRPRASPGTYPEMLTRPRVLEGVPGTTTTACIVLDTSTVPAAPTSSPLYQTPCVSTRRASSDDAMHDRLPTGPGSSPRPTSRSTPTSAPRRRLRGEQGQRHRATRRSGPDRVHPHLRRERRVLDHVTPPTPPAARPAVHLGRRVSDPIGLGFRCPASSCPRGRSAVTCAIARRPHVGHPAAGSPACQPQLSAGGGTVGDFSAALAPVAPRSAAPGHDPGWSGRGAVRGSRCRSFPGTASGPPPGTRCGPRRAAVGAWTCFT